MCSRKEESQQETNCTTECKQSYASEEAGIIFLSKCETEVHAQYLLQKKKGKKRLKRKFRYKRQLARPRCHSFDNQQHIYETRARN